jgi:hypothetical protein
MGVSCRDGGPVPAVVTSRGSRLIRGDLLHWRIFYAEWVVNATVGFITDAHHRGLLWSLPRKILQSIPILGLPYLLEGTRYDVTGVTQLLGLIGSVNWKGYEKVGAIPIQRLGVEFRPMELGIQSGDRDPTWDESVTIADGDESEEVLASGNLARPTSPLRRSGLPGEISVSIPRLRAAPAMGERLKFRSALVRDPVHIPRLGERNIGVREVTHRQSVPPYRGGKARDGHDDLERDVTMGSKLTRFSSEVQP